MNQKLQKKKKKVVQVLAIILLLAVLIGLYLFVRSMAYEAGRRKARLEHKKTLLLQQQTDSIVNTAEVNN